MMEMMYSSCAKMDSSSVQREEVLALLDDIAMLCIRSNFVSTRVKLLVTPDVVELAS